MKKILSLILALLMIGSTATMIAAEEADAAAEATTTAAADEIETTDKIEFLYKHHIMYGVSETEVDLDLTSAIERYQMALFVARISTGWTKDDAWEDDTLNTSGFTDVVYGEEAGAYLGAISYASQKGIIEGYGDGKFGPYDGITYQDALTMIVRTLGYTDLGWPWGFITKAVELDITLDESVAYTTELNRGQVAELIYKALFATANNGSTLATDNFGLSAWTPIIITQSTGNSSGQYGANWVVPEVDLSGWSTQAGIGGSYENINKDAIGNGWIAFHIYDPATGGYASDTTYYVLASDLGLDVDKHEDEVAVGLTYWVMFEEIGGNSVSISEYKSNVIDVLWNYGNDGENGAFIRDVEAYLKTVTLVSKYTPANWLSGNKSMKPEIMLYNALWGTDMILESTSKTDTYPKVGIDLESGDIVEINEDAAAAADRYTVLWYWNGVLQKYFRYQLTANNTVYGFEYMEKEDALALYDFTYNMEDIRNTTARSVILTAPATSAYASLIVEDANRDGVGDRALYEEYGLGYVSGTPGKAGFSIQDVTNRMVTYMNLGNMGELLGESASAGNILTPNRLADHGYWEDGANNPYGMGVWILHIEGWWLGTDTYINPTTLKTDAEYSGNTIFYGWKDQEASGWLTNGDDVQEAGAYVIYSLDLSTYEVKIVKTIYDFDDEKRDDDDSYVAYGILRGYSTTQRKVVIGDKVFSTDYDQLKNNGFAIEDTANTGKADTLAEGLDSLMNQYVKYVVVDGKVVCMNLEATGKAATYLIVNEFAGLTNDGYIAVEAFDLATGELGIYCIDSYNGWHQGDYYYYLSSEAASEAFAPGTMYYVKSYNASEDAYNVELVGGYNEVGNAYELADGAVATTNKTFSFTSDGYRWDNAGGTNGFTATSASDTYIILPSEQDLDAPIYYFQGKVLNSTWSVAGQLVNAVSGSNVFVFVNATVSGFDLDKEQNGMYLYQGGNVVEAVYDSWYVTENGIFASEFSDGERYLVGAYTFKVKALNLYTGAYETIIVDRNMKLIPGAVYMTNNYQIVRRVEVTTLRELYNKMRELYKDDLTNLEGSVQDATTAKYLFGTEDCSWGGALGAAFFAIYLERTEYYDDVVYARVQYVTIMDLTIGEDGLITYNGNTSDGVGKFAYIYSPAGLSIVTFCID